MDDVRAHGKDERIEIKSYYGGQEFPTDDHGPTKRGGPTR